MTDVMQQPMPGGPILASDVNQILKVLARSADAGALGFLAPLNDNLSQAPALAAGAAGNPNGPYLCVPALVSGIERDDGGVVVNGLTAVAAGGPNSNFVTVANAQIQWTDIPTGPTGTVGRALYRSPCVAAPSSALTLATVSDASSTLQAVPYYVAIDYGTDYYSGAFDSVGWSGSGASEATITPASANAYDIQFAVTLPANVTRILVGVGTAPGADAVYAAISAAGVVTYYGTNSTGIAALASGSTITVTISKPPSDTVLDIYTGTGSQAATYTPKFCGWLSDNTTTSYPDNIADAALGTGMPTSSSYPPVYGNAIPASAPATNTTGTYIARAVSGTAPAIGGVGNVIATTGIDVARVAPTSAATGTVLQAGVVDGQVVRVINQATTAGYSVAFAAAGTSNVADGTSDVIAISTGATYVWSAASSLWYRV